jgi:hypothetical protein
MASIEEVKAGIMAATNEISNAGGASQQVHSSYQQAQAMLQRVTDGTSQADVSEATGLLSRAMDLIVESQQAASAAIQAAEGVAARL